jgi:hypothetical protein
MPLQHYSETGHYFFFEPFFVAFFFALPFFAAMFSPPVWK